MSETELKMNLLENAFDFLDEAAKRLENADDELSTNYKYAILHLVSGVELLLKQRLYDEHWSLIFADVNQADKNKLDTGDFKSVYLDDAIKRLENISQLTFPQQHRDILTALKKERNRLEHYHVSINKAHAASLLVKTWSFVVDFVSNELKSSQHPFIVPSLNTRMRRVESLKAYVDHRLSEIAPRIKQLEQDGIEIIPCFNCLQQTMPYRESSYMECLFCRAGVVS